jgi:hypothetical protein
MSFLIYYVDPISRIDARVATKVSYTTTFVHTQLKNDFTCT